ncbi:MAG: 2-phospho-L-lactate transferase CofD family protein, partial [Dehalococcoidia bacterium]
TEDGPLPFQVYFVQRHCEPRITGVRFDGAEASVPSPAFLTALQTADAIVYCPSNPLVSIRPVLAVPGVREAIQAFAGPRIAVSPIVGGQALKGPAAKMMVELGQEVNSAGVARHYPGLCDTLVLDTTDAAEAASVESLGMQALVTKTVMATEEDKTTLAREIIAYAEAWRGR